MNEQTIKHVAEAILELWDRPEHDLGIPSTKIVAWVFEAYNHTLSPQDLEDALDELVTRQCVHWMEDGDSHITVFEVESECLMRCNSQNLTWQTMWQEIALTVLCLAIFIVHDPTPPR